MQKVIGVECWADYYFFGRLLNDSKIIRKEKNKNEVLKSITERAKGSFSVGVVDHDKKELTVYLKETEIEGMVTIGEYIHVSKFAGSIQFVIELKPVEFEIWINEFLKTEGKSVADFGYESLKEFIEESKSIYEVLLSKPRFIKLMDFIFEHYKNSDNHIRKIKLILEYLLKNRYQADINELINV